MYKNLMILILGLITSSTITAQGYYLGVYNNSVNPSCGSSYCHESMVSKWEVSAHANAHPANSTSYGYSCLQCHNTGWDETTDNLGADEFVRQDTDLTPDYVVNPENQADWEARQGVQCESCHGPVGTSEGILDWNHTDRQTDYSAENCGQCHEGSHHPYYSEWEESGHASGPPVYLDLSNRAAFADCMYCHFAQDFQAFLENPEYNAHTFQIEGGDDTLQDITCVACHDPHGSDNPGSLRTLPAEFDDKVVCDVCHTVHEEEIDFNDAPHHTTSEVLSSSSKFGWQYPEEDYSAAKSFHSLIRERCVACHMHEASFNYATGEAAVTGHTFEPAVEACVECHSDYLDVVDIDNEETMFDYRGVQTETLALIEQLQQLLDQATSADSTTDKFKKALYNLNAVEAEGSRGIHNTKLVQKLLQDAIDRFIITSVDDKSGLPSSYSLTQNYPNPFNPTTQIEFSIPETANVSLVVYDILGREVAELVNQVMASGSYTVSWNANENSTGIYFYKITANNFVEIRKMLLIK